MNEITNYCKNCDAWCCYDGVYLTDDDISKITKVVENNKDFFGFLPTDYIVYGEWEGQTAGQKTNVKEKFYSKNYPKHFNQTACVFLNGNKCMLEEFAVLNNQPNWKYKPKRCCTFPLQKRDNNFVEPHLVEDDCNLGDKYPGFVSYLPCYKLNIDKFNKEVEFATDPKIEDN